MPMEMENENNQPVSAKQKAKDVWGGVVKGYEAVKKVIGIIVKYILLLHKPLLAIPVIYLAVRIYLYAREKLPETVGILLQESGAYTWMLDRQVALTGCMAVTAVCLLLMFVSRRTIYPWLISAFSLVLPFVLIVTNTFPA